ncbi:hypothetical protein BKA67DRAFT_397844 [Truncatella angustata]|uniref:Uncharacterized protein n=1 Tax=Truncatella angustata TaxID=152316 RepID=A0A9P8RQ84_9PEZI|nr:uncharacterized protein BKA67DRAFT_397844 [Truncatella angustata]KAH6647777.1 hypothetical protein BKA67DRAFT_397844 [Truncatella angustata]
MPVRTYTRATSHATPSVCGHLPQPEGIHAQRFVDLRNYKFDDRINHKNCEQHQFIAVANENMGVSHGTPACPDRAFAANEIKLILAQMLLQYDIRLPQGTHMPPMIAKKGCFVDKSEGADRVQEGHGCASA